MISAFQNLGRRTGFFLVVLLSLVLDGSTFPTFCRLPRARTRKSSKKDEREEGEEEKPKKTTRPRVVKRQEVEESDLKPDETRPIDLAAEAKLSGGEIRDFLIGLSVPHDLISHPGRACGSVEPLARFIVNPPKFSGMLATTGIEKNNKRNPLKPIGAKDIGQVVPFSGLVLQEVSAFLGKKDMARLLASEKALVFALRFHGTTRQAQLPRTLKNGRNWKN